jgi:hypothetical protein
LKVTALPGGSAGKGRIAFQGEGIEAKLSRIPPRYGDFGMSGLKVDVQRGENTFNIGLK